MAYRDYNGKITIDEAAAQNDIRKIQAAIQKLEAARSSATRMAQEAATLKGQTAKAIEEKSVQMRHNLDRLIQNLNQEVSAIKQAVVKYQRLDREVKAAIQRELRKSVL